MKNNQLLPFERNRYYAGKMLTSSDFQTEQTYFNNKRRFINNAMYGSGIVCGCGVVSLDDLSILVESGVAIDDYGREIVIDSSIVKKLSAIDGFEKLESNHIALCLRYKEEDVHSVYSVNYQETGREYEYNRISEGYEIFLMDAELMNHGLVMEDEFMLRTGLYLDEDYEIELSMPAILCKGIYAKISVNVKKLSTSTAPITFKGTLQMPVCTTLNGSHELEILLENINLLMETSITKDYWIKTQDAEAAGVELIIKSGTAKVIIDGKENRINNTAPIKINIENISPDDLISREIGKLSLEMRNIGNKKDYLCLANLNLVRTDSAYLIEDITENNVKRYIAAPVQHQKRIAYSSCFASEKQEMISQNSATESVKERQEKENNSRPMMATGILEIPLGDQVSRGDIRYSGEIMHGLGKGNVFVTIGYEYFKEDAALGANARSTIYGDPELFRGDQTGVSDVETAVKVLNDKGSFVVAASILKEIDYLVLNYRWVAIKFPTEEDKSILESYKDKSITAATPTVVLGTKESYYFDINFHNMEACSIAYELTENNSGEITSDGVYTAPSKEGVYEIRIYCTDMPVICTYAYAIVKKKGIEDE